MITYQDLRFKYLWSNKFLVLINFIFGISGAIFNGIGTALIIPTILIILGQEEAIKGIKLFEILTDRLDYFPENQRVLVMASLVFLVICLKNINTVLAKVCDLRLSQVIIKDLLYQALYNLSQVSIYYFNSNKVGNIISNNTGEIFKTANSIKSCVKIAVVVFSILSFALTLVIMSWQLTIIATVLLALIFLFNQFIINKSRWYGAKLTPKIREFANRLIEFVMGIRLIKTVNQEKKEYEMLQQIYQERENLQFKSQLFSSLIAPVNDTFGIFLILSLIVVGKYLFIEQFRAFSSLILVYLAILIRLIPYFNQLNSLRSQLAQESASVKLVVEMLNTQEKLLCKNGHKEYQSIYKGIYFQGVSFTYPGYKELVLNNIDLLIPQGKTTALVGTSGAGKSTIADLLIRFYDPTQGKISIDGTDLREFDVASLYKHIGIVSQDTFLFNETVTHNIAYGLEEVTEREIIAAAKGANAYDFIMALPQGFETRIGDRGVLLSGGQKQRLAIARALLRNPDILILDEATSALDTVSEKLVQDAIDNLSQDRTTIVIAHRLSTIQKADQIVVLEKGRVLEVGSHQELLKLQGKYSQLYATQFTETAKSPQDLSYQSRLSLNFLLGSLRLLADGLIDSTRERQQLIEESYQSALNLLTLIEKQEQRNQLSD